MSTISFPVTFQQAGGNCLFYLECLTFNILKPPNLCQALAGIETKEMGGEKMCS
jgi:hypothetical protein